jgi:hypothetical protein
LLVAVAVITTFPATLGAVYVEFAPLTVCAGLNDPQDPAGVQLQSTPELELSLETVAAIDAVPPAFMVVGGTAARDTETAAGVVVFEAAEPEPTAPHPERLIAKSTRTIFARSAAAKFFRIKYTGFSIIRILCWNWSAVGWRHPAQVSG